MTSGRLESVLTETSHLARRRAVQRGLALGLAVIAVSLLVATILDAMLALNTVGLLVLDAALLAIMAGVAVDIARRWAAHRYDPRRVARFIESRMDVGDSSLINAIDLSMAAEAPSISRRLVEYAVQLGQTAAERVVPQRVVDIEPLKKALVRSAIALLVLLGAYALMPRMFHMVWPRMAMPTANLPPYTSIDFAIDTKPERLLYGKPADVQVTLTGPRLPDHASLVFVDGAAEQRVPLVRFLQAASDAQPDAAHFMLHIDRAEHSRRAYVDSPRGRSGVFDLTVHPVPLFESVTVTYDYPTYTGWEPVEGSLDTGSIRALAGTRITLRAASNLPLGESRMQWTPVDADGASGKPSDIAFTPSPDNAKTAVGRFEIQHNGELSLELIGADGTPGLKPMQCTVKAVADEMPAVQIDQPDRRLVVPEGWSVDVKASASDDIGVARMLIHRSVNGWGPWSVELAAPAGITRAVDAAYHFDLPALGAVAGDVVTYFVAAHDNHPSGTHVTETDIYSIEIITQDEYDQYMRTQYGIEEMTAEWQAYQDALNDLAGRRLQLLDQMEDLQEKLESGELTEQQAAEQLAALQEELQQFQEDVDKLAKHMAERAASQPIYDFETPYQQMLQQISKDLGAQSTVSQAGKQAYGQLAQQNTATTRQQAQQALQAMQQQVAPFDTPQQEQQQQLTQDLEKVRAANDMIAQAERIRAMVDRQRDLADRMAQFRQSNKLSGAALERAKGMAEEQAARAELEDAVEKLADAAKQHAETLPKMSRAAGDIADAVKKMDVPGDQGAAQRMASAGQGKGAHQAAKDAAEKLESLLSDCEPMEGNAPDDLDGCLKLPRRSWANSMAQLSQSRGIPGMGQQGGDGSGMTGSNARMTVQGPARVGRGNSMAEGRFGFGRGRGRTERNNAAAADAAETLSPDQTETARGAGAYDMPGVPVRYRDVAHAYFRRLAEEAAKAQNRGDP